MGRRRGRGERIRGKKEEEGGGECGRERRREGEESSIGSGISWKNSINQCLTSTIWSYRKIKRPPAKAGERKKFMRQKIGRTNIRTNLIIINRKIREHLEMGETSSSPTHYRFKAAVFPVRFLAFPIRPAAIEGGSSTGRSGVNVDCSTPPAIRTIGLLRVDVRQFHLRHVHGREY